MTTGRFQAHVCEIHSQFDIECTIHTLLEHKKIDTATHPAIRAYRYIDDAGRLIEGADDDGETGASERLLYLLQAGDVCMKFLTLS